MKIVTENKDGYDPSVGYYGASRVGIEHEGKVICWSGWDDQSGDDLLREMVRRYNELDRTRIDMTPKENQDAKGEQP